MDRGSRSKSSVKGNQPLRPTYPPITFHPAIDLSPELRSFEASHSEGSIPPSWNRRERGDLQAANPLSAVHERRSFHLRETSLANRLDEKRQISKLERTFRGREYLLPSRDSLHSSFPLFPPPFCASSPLSPSSLDRSLPRNLFRERRTSVVVRQSVSCRVINQSSSWTCETRSAALSRVHTHARARAHLDGLLSASARRRGGEG